MENEGVYIGLYGLPSHDPHGFLKLQQFFLNMHMVTNLQVGFHVVGIFIK